MGMYAPVNKFKSPLNSTVNMQCVNANIHTQIYNICICRHTYPKMSKIVLVCVCACTTTKPNVLFNCQLHRFPVASPATTTTTAATIATASTCKQFVCCKQHSKTFQSFAATYPESPLPYVLHPCCSLSQGCCTFTVLTHTRRALP